MLLRDIELRQLLKDLKMLYPGIYNGVFKRIYADDNRFHDRRLPLWLIGNSLTKVDKAVAQERLTPSQAFSYQQISKAGKYDFPLFFVEPELFQACSASGLPKGLKLAELKMPFPAFTFILPKGAFPTKEGEVPFITVATDPIGKSRIDLGRRMLNVDTTDSGLIISTFFPKDAGDFIVRVTDSLYNSETLPAFHEHLVSGEDDDIMERPLFGDDTKALDDLTLKLSSLVPALIMAMECRPEVFTRERLLKQVRRRDKAIEYWEPNRIGRGFRIKLEGDLEAGSHSSPRAHVRRGHFRLQPIGSKTCKCGCPKKMHDGSKFYLSE